MERDNIWVRASGLEAPLGFRIEPQSVLLLGRHPDPSRLTATLKTELGDRKILCGSIPSTRVSANHLLIWHTGGALRLWDLASRNGSWVQLRAQQRFEVRGALVLALDLGQSGNAAPLDQLPKSAEWQSEREFSGAVAQALRDWLNVLDLHTEVSLEFSPPAHADGCFALADGSELRVLPVGDATHEFPWSGVLDRVRIYINDQNNTFELLQGHDEGFILASRPLRETHRQLADAAARGMRVLLLGPTGVGKERLATCYHRHSRQHRGPFVTVNCSLLKQDLLFAQLFGAKKGSFTGSTADLIGVVEAAHEGTLFLDEIGEMSEEVQRALLRFLDSRGEYQRLGDARTRRANVQIVCATHVELDEPTRRAERFREDLWYRLAVRVVRVPPLRERREDIVAYLKSRALGGGVSAYEALSAAALQRVLDDPWPGNFRDLENFVERLPATGYAHSIDDALCVAAIQEGRGVRKQLPSAFSEQPVQASADWPEIAAQAAVAFARDHGLQPGQWGQTQIFMEKYLKPVFLAQACGLGLIDEVGKGLNMSELARRMNIADGTTVKLQLQRYIKRFRRQGQLED